MGTELTALVPRNGTEHGLVEMRGNEITAIPVPNLQHANKPTYAIERRLVLEKSGPI